MLEPQPPFQFKQTVCCSSGNVVVKVSLTREFSESWHCFYVNTFPFLMWHTFINMAHGISKHAEVELTFQVEHKEMLETDLKVMSMMVMWRVRRHVLPVHINILDCLDLVNDIVLLALLFDVHMKHCKA